MNLSSTFLCPLSTSHSVSLPASTLTPHISLSPSLTSYQSLHSGPCLCCSSVRGCYSSSVLCFLFLCVFIHLSHSHLPLFFLSIKIPPAPGVSELAKFGYVYQKRKKREEWKKLRNVGSCRATLWETNYEF